jgi:polyisoprenoid-binding protein YceI
MKILKLFFPIFCFIFFVGTIYAGTKVTLQAVKGESMIEYTLVHPLHTVEGISKDFDCSVSYDKTDDEVTDVKVQADVLTFDSGNSNRDSHMAEVVDALDYPDVTFDSDSVVYVKQDTLLIMGKLNFHNVTKDILCKVSETLQNNETIFNGGFDISLTEFKIKRPSLLMMPVEDKLSMSFKIVLPLELKKQ